MPQISSYPQTTVGGRLKGGRLNIKMPSYQYRDSHVKDKTVSPTVLSLTWESPYLGKTVFILRQGPDSILNLICLILELRKDMYKIVFPPDWVSSHNVTTMILFASESDLADHPQLHIIKWSISWAARVSIKSSGNTKVGKPGSNRMNEITIHYSPIIS